MKKNLIVITVFVISIIGCKEATITPANAGIYNESVIDSETKIMGYTDEKGNKFEVAYPSLTTAILKLNSTEYDLKKEVVSIGYLYKNNQFVLSGNGESFELKKDGITLFKN